MDEDFRKAALELRQQLQSRRKESLSKRLRPFFTDEESLQAFLSEAMKNQEAHRMLLHLDWYTELADLIEAIRPERAPLRLIFLLAGAENLMRKRAALEKNSVDANHMKSWDVISQFFAALSQDNQNRLLRGVRRPLGDEKGVEFSIEEIVRILWQARNDAAHGVDFYTFQTPESPEVADGGLLTEGRMNRDEDFFPLDMQITFEEIQNIILETALEHVKAVMSFPVVTHMP